MITKKRKGVIIAVGGHENKIQNSEIIGNIVQKSLRDTLAVMPIRSEVQDYKTALNKNTFRQSGIKHLYFLNPQIRI